MTVGVAAGVHSQYGGRHNGVAEQQYDPVNRAHKFFVGAAPAHALGYWQCGKGLINDAGQQVGRLFAWPGGLVVKLCHLAVILLAQVGDADTAGSGKTFGGLGRLAVCIVSRLQCGAEFFNGRIGLALL